MVRTRAATTAGGGATISCARGGGGGGGGGAGAGGSGVRAPAPLPPRAPRRAGFCSSKGPPAPRAAAARNPRCRSARSPSLQASNGEESNDDDVDTDVSGPGLLPLRRAAASGAAAAAARATFAAAAAVGPTAPRLPAMGMIAADPNDPQWDAARNLKTRLDFSPPEGLTPGSFAWQRARWELLLRGRVTHPHVRSWHLRECLREAGVLGEVAHCPADAAAEELWDRLAERLLTGRVRFGASAALLAMRQEPGEALVDYQLRFRRQSTGLGLTEPFLVSMFIASLTDLGDLRQHAEEAYLEPPAAAAAAAAGASTPATVEQLCALLGREDFERARQWSAAQEWVPVLLPVPIRHPPIAKKRRGERPALTKRERKAAAAQRRAQRLAARAQMGGV
jgi:hypothetical protein